MIDNLFFKEYLNKKIEMKTVLSIGWFIQTLPHTYSNEYILIWIYSKLKPNSQNGKILLRY